MNRTIEDIQKDIELLGIKGGYDIEQLLTPQDCRRLSYEIERLNNIINELKKELNKDLRHYHNLLPMKQYPIERDVFCKIFRKIDSDFYDELYDTTTESFKVWRYDDEFYILHLESGTIINWYKHLGRCNTCNKNLSIEEYKKLANDLYNELKGSNNN